MIEVMLSTVKNDFSRQATKKFGFLSFLMWETMKVLVEFHSPTPLMRSRPPLDDGVLFTPTLHPPFLLEFFPSYVIIKRSLSLPRRMRRLF